MCVAIVRTPNNVLTDAVLKACFEANHHGAGFAYVDKEGKLTAKKGYFEFDKFLEAYRPIEEEVQALGPMLVHFRISTSGTKTEDNCHPFLFEHGALIHNGVFFSTYGDKSDTHMLVDSLGKKLDKANVQLHKEAFGKYIGLGNKIAILYPDRSYEIINEDRGEWVNGNWFSNDYWMWRARNTERTPNGGTIVRDHRSSYRREV